MLVYNKVLEQNGYFQFDLMQVAGTSDLRAAIKKFFDNHEAGVHAAVVCTDNPNEIMHEEDFCTALSCGGTWQVELLQSDGNRPTDADRTCACRGQFELIGQALLEALECGKQVVDECYINSKANSLIQALITIEDQRLFTLENLWSRVSAVNSSEILDLAQLKADHQTVPDIRILLFLPKKHFETFLKPECYFPTFLEYVVLGEDEAMLLQENQKLKERLRQLEKNFLALEENSQHLEEYIQTLLLENRELKEKILQREKSDQVRNEIYLQVMELLQKIDPHDRLGEKPETTIGLRVTEWQQDPEKKSVGIEETPIRNEYWNQIEPDDYEAQTTKLPERIGGHIGEKDKQLNTRTNRKEPGDRTGGRSDTGR